jgi:hypothetical protein
MVKHLIRGHSGGYCFLVEKLEAIVQVRDGVTFN